MMVKTLHFLVRHYFCAPSLQWVPCADFPAVSWPGSEADCSPPSSAEVNAWSFTSTPRISIHGVVLGTETILP
jgi:hypothetical protein